MPIVTISFGFILTCIILPLTVALLTVSSGNSIKLSLRTELTGTGTVRFTVVSLPATSANLIIN